MRLVGGWLVWLNLAAFGMALVQWVVGIEHFFPRNAATEIMYNSADVGEEGLFRIPSLFSSAHAFGGTMVASLPLLLLRSHRPEGRSWTDGRGGWPPSPAASSVPRGRRWCSWR